MEALAQALARRRVTLGFVFAIAVLCFASPSRESLMAGAAIGVVGEAIRIWAAGHLEKSREVTTSGPYRFTRHPLYLGSSIMALGIAVGCRSIPVAGLVFLYMASTIGAAIRTEEAFLRARFGDAYDAYTEARAPQVERRFSFERAWRNKEYRALIGLFVALLLLVFRGWLAH
jgi:protein-S-isoprenylcysteine O-methyltransferase Ste14